MFGPNVIHYGENEVMFLWLFKPLAGLDLCASSTFSKHFLLTPRCLDHIKAKVH